MEVKKRLGGLSRTRNYYRLDGLAPSVDFRVHSCDLVSLERGVLERVFYVKDEADRFNSPPKPIPGVYESEFAKFFREVTKYLRSTIPITPEHFVSLYKDRRKHTYAAAAEDLLIHPLTRKDARTKSFVKADKLNFDAKPDPAPRIIQPRSPRYNVAVGCYIKPIEKRVYRAINKVFGHPTVMKGYNASQVGTVIAAKWHAFSVPVGITIDAKRFDQHVHVPALKCEHEIYYFIYRSSKGKLRKLLDMQLENNGVCYTDEGVLIYTRDGTRCSGDMNTALGNIILMCSMVYTYMLPKNIKYQLVNNGDDSTIITEAKHIHLFDDLKPYFLSLGFSMKIENIAYELEKIVFCQASPVWTPDGYRMVRDPHISLAKDCTCIFSLTSPSSLSKYCSVFGEAGLSLTSGIPILQEFYKVFKRVPYSASNYVMESGMAMLASGMSPKEAPVHARTRYSFWRAFNITPDEQRVFEEIYTNATLTWTPGVDPEPFPPWPPTV